MYVINLWEFNIELTQNLVKLALMASHKSTYMTSSVEDCVDNFEKNFSNFPFGLEVL
jgi:hypothetical protein